MIVRSPAALTAPPDILVVGAGAVGLPLAITLSRSGLRVLVVEGGGEKLLPEYKSINAGLQSGRSHLGLTRGRYQGLGGTTRLWGGQLTPFSSSDFKPDSGQGKPGWPFDAVQLQPWVDRALELLGIVGGFGAVERDWERKAGELGPFGESLTISPSVWMREPDFTVHFAAEIASLTGMQVLTDHSAVGLSIDAERGVVDGAVLRRRDGSELVIHASRTIVACGTLETSRLLLRAKAAHPATPLARNAHVGRWFVDHLHGIAGRINPTDREGFGKIFDTFYAQRHKMTPKLRLSDEMVSANGLSNCALTVNGRFGPGEALREARYLARRMLGRSGDVPLLEALRRSSASARILLPLAWRYLRTRRSGKFLAGDVLLGVEIEQVPNFNSYIELEQGVPPQHAQIDLHWSIDGREINAVSAAVNSACVTFAARGLGTVEVDTRVLAGDSSFLEDCTDASHQIGGARMAKSETQGVTDGDGQVFGMPGLYVAGAATFPSGSFANPTLTAIATALRMADMLVRTRA